MLDAVGIVPYTVHLAPGAPLHSEARWEATASTVGASHAWSVVSPEDAGASDVGQERLAPVLRNRKQTVAKAAPAAPGLS
jgi:hypothetical protein